MEPTTPAPTTPPVAPLPAAPEPVPSVSNATPSSFVSPDYTGPSNSPFSKQNAFKIFIALLAVVIIGELAWAGYTLTRPIPAAETGQPPFIAPAPSVPPMAAIALMGPTEATVGARIKVEVQIATTEQTDGADVILKYDPKVLQAMIINTGAIYPEYPIKTIDAAAGTISISGVSGTTAAAFSDQGIFGNIEFKALRAGQTVVAVVYTAEATIDSNVLGSKAEKDILNKVQDLTINIR